MATTIGVAYVQVKPDKRSVSDFHREVQSRIGRIKLNVDQSKGAFAPLGKISADLNQFQNSLDASVARTLAFGASVGVIGGTVRSIKAVIDSFIEVEKSIADINAVFKLTAPELKGFTAGLFDVARDTAQSFKDVATAATEFSRQGLSVGETLKRTESAMKLVRLAGLETTQAANVLTAAMNGFSSAGLESQEIVNKLATVDAAYAVSSSDLALALSRAGDTAQGAKVSFDELLGAVTAVQQRTARGGAVIGNGLKSIFTRLQRSKVQGALEDVGVATKDADGNIRESMSILRDYAGVYNTLSDSQRAFTDEQIAGVYQINTLKALVRDLTNEYGVYNGAVRTSTEATDEAEKRMAALSQTTDAKLKRISASFAEFSSMGGKDIFGPMISRLSNVAEGALSTINSAMKSDNKGLGGTLLSGITEGLGSFLAGPGLIIGLKAAVKLVGFLGKEAITAARQVSQIGSESQKRVQLEQQVLGLLQTDSSLVAQIASGTLNAANANRLIEASLTKQLQLSERIASFQKNVGAFVGSNPAIIATHAQQFGTKSRRFAGGYAPTLRKEKSAIAQGVGGARSGDKPVVIPEFNYGGGKRGPAVAHTGEWFVPHFNGGSAIFNRDMAESYGLPSGAVRVGMAGGHIPNFIDFRSSSPSKVKSKSGFRMQYLLGDKVPKGSSAIVDQLRSDPYIAQIDKTFKSLGLPEPKAGIRDFLLDTNREGKLFSSTGGVYYPKTGASIVGQRGADATDFMGILGHEVGGHHLDATFQNSPAAKQKGIGGYISDDPRFVSKFKRVYGSWKSKGPEAKISPVLKRIFSRIEESGDIYSGQKSLRREVFADISQYLYGRGSNKLTMRTGIGKFVNDITGATSFAGGYDPLGQAVSREADAVGSSKVRVGTHPSLKAPHNPMGIGVYNSSEGSLSNGIRMARAVGLDPKTKGMADGHVPNFAPKIPISQRVDAAQIRFDERVASAGSDAAEAARAMAALQKNLRALAKEALTAGDDIGLSKAQLAMGPQRVVSRPLPSGPASPRSPPQGAWRVTDEIPTSKSDIADYVRKFQERTTIPDPPSLYGRVKEKIKQGSNRAFSYTEEQRTRGRGQGRFGMAFGAQIGGGIIRSAGEGTKAAKGLGVFADSLDVAATALTLIPGDAGLAAAAIGGFGTLLYGLVKDRNDEKFSAALEKNALAANRSAQALADVTQSYTAYEAAMESRDPVRMTVALNKLTEKIFKIGEFDVSAMQGALSAIASGDPREGLATAQEAISKRQASTANINELYQASKSARGFFSNLGGLEKGSFAESKVSIKEGVSADDAMKSISRALEQAVKDNDIDGALKTLGDVIDGGTQAIEAFLEGGFGGDIGGVSKNDRQIGFGQISKALLNKTNPLFEAESFVSATKGPLAEVARTQKEVAAASRIFSFELEKAAANIQIFSESASRGFEATMNFRDKQFSSSLETLRTGDRITEREALNIGTLEDRTKITANRDFGRNKIGAEARAEGLGLGDKLLTAGGAGKEKGSAAINDLFTRADKLAQSGDTGGLKELFSKKSIDALGLGGEKNDEVVNAIQKSGADMITKLGVLEADSARNLDFSSKQADLQSKILDASIYQKTFWASGGTQKDATEIAEAIRRIEMARAKGDLTISEREQLSADLSSVKSQSGISYDAELEKLNTGSVAAALTKNVLEGNTQYAGAQKTASTQAQVDEAIREMETKYGDGSNTSDKKVDFARRYVEAKRKGDAAFRDLEDNVFEMPDMSEVNTSFQAVRTESDKLAAAFAVLAQKTDVGKEAELNYRLANKDAAREGIATKTKAKVEERKSSDDKRIAELLKVVEKNKDRDEYYKKTETAVGEKRVYESDVAANRIKEIRDAQVKDEAFAKSEESKLFLESLKRIADSVTAASSPGGAQTSEAEINGAIRVELSTNTLTADLATAIKETLEGKSNAIAKQALAFAFKGLSKP